MLGWHHDIEYNDIQPKDNQHNNKNLRLSVLSGAECFYAW
jgi:hypothetical protein